MFLLYRLAMHYPGGCLTGAGWGSDRCAGYMGIGEFWLQTNESAANACVFAGSGDFYVFHKITRSAIVIYCKIISYIHC
jgi:hypothetical protein